MGLVNSTHDVFFCKCIIYYSLFSKNKETQNNFTAHKALIKIQKGKGKRVDMCGLLDYP